MEGALQSLRMVALCGVGILVFTASFFSHNAFGRASCGDYSNFLIRSSRSSQSNRLQIHEVKAHKGFDRYLVSLKGRGLTSSLAYIDYYQPESITFRFTQDAYKGKLGRISKRVAVMDAPPQLKGVKAPAELEGLVRSAFLGSARDIRKQIKALFKRERFRQWRGQTFVVQNNIECEIRFQNNTVEIQIRPAIGRVKVHRSVMNPLEYRVYGMEKGISPFFDAIRYMDNMHEADMRDVQSLSVQVRKWLVHPNPLLRFARKMIDAPLFGLFQPYFLISDRIRGVQIGADYPNHRKGILGSTLIYFLFEMLFYTTLSKHYSEDHNPDEAWRDILFQYMVHRDLYLIGAQKEFDDDGVTALWIAVGDDDVFDKAGQQLSYIIQKIRFKFWNTVMAIYGAPTANQIEEYDVIELREDGVRPIALVYVHREKDEIMYSFSDPVPNSDDQANVFKALFPIIRRIGCEDEPEECGIKNVMTISHGSSGYLSKITHLDAVARFHFDVEYECLNEEGCRGLGDELRENRFLDAAHMRSHLMPSPNFVFYACSVAEGTYGQEAINQVARFFDIENKKGRITAAKKIVLPIFLLFPFEGSDKARYYNHWTFGDLARSYFMFGPSMVEDIYHKWQNGENIWGPTEEDIYDLDYRGG